MIGRVESHRSVWAGHALAAGRYAARGSQIPFVRVADKLPPADKLRDELDDRVERRVTSNMDPQYRTYYREEVEDRITAYITPVDSLQG